MGCAWCMTLGPCPVSPGRAHPHSGRPFEAGLTLEYLQQLHAAYEGFLLDISREIPVIRIDWSTFRKPAEVAHILVQEWETFRSLCSVQFRRGLYTLSRDEVAVRATNPLRLFRPAAAPPAAAPPATDPPATDPPAAAPTAAAPTAAEHETKP